MDCESPSCARLGRGGYGLLGNRVYGGRATPGYRFENYSFEETSVFTGERSFGYGVIPPETVLPRSILLAPGSFFGFYPSLGRAVTGRSAFVHFRVGGGRRVSDF